MTLPKLFSTHVLESTHVAPDSLLVESGLNFLLWLSDPPSHTALCLSNPFSPYFPNRLCSLLPRPVTYLVSSPVADAAGALPRPPFLGWHPMPWYKAQKTGPLVSREGKPAVPAPLRSSCYASAEPHLCLASLPLTYPVFFTYSETFL